MKKSVTLLLVLVFSLALLAGCGNNSGKVDDIQPSGDSEPQNSQDDSNNNPGNSTAAGGLSGKYLRTDNDNYFEFFEDGTCVLYHAGIDFKMDGKYSVSGNTITFAEGSEFDYDVTATINGDAIEWNDDVYLKEGASAPEVSAPVEEAAPEPTPEPEAEPESYMMYNEIQKGISFSYSSEAFDLDDNGFQLVGNGGSYLLISFLHNLNVDFNKESDNLIANYDAAETEATIGGFTARRFAYEKYSCPAATYIVRYDEPVDAYYNGNLVGQYDGVIINIYADKEEDIDGPDVMDVLNSYAAES